MVRRVNPFRLGGPTTQKNSESSLTMIDLIIVKAALAMEYGASCEDIARVCHAHPTCSGTKTDRYYFCGIFKLGNSFQRLLFSSKRSSFVTRY